MTVPFRSNLFASADEADGYRRAIGELVWRGDIDAAEARLGSDLAGMRHSVAAVCLESRIDDVTVRGWDAVVERLAGSAYTAVGFDLSEHGDSAVDAFGRCPPYIEVSYYTDAAFPFSSASLDDLRAARNEPWIGCFDDIDSCIEIEGMDELYGAVRALEEAGHRSQGPHTTAADFDVMLVGACLRHLLFHRAIVRQVADVGWDQPVAVIIGANEVFPFFSGFAHDRNTARLSRRS